MPLGTRVELLSGATLPVQKLIEYPLPHRFMCGTSTFKYLKTIACAAASLFVSNSGFNCLRISARYLVSNSAELHGYISSLLIGLFLPYVWSNSGFDQSEATISILATQRDFKQDIVH